MYRGHDYERIGAFTQRLQAEYVAAHILMRNTPPDDSIIANDGQCEFTQSFIIFKLPLYLYTSGPPRLHSKAVIFIYLNF